MNLFDRLIAAISPVSGLRRAAARAAMGELTLRNRYEAARSDRSLDGWWTTGASADAEIGTQAQRLRNRARDLARNNPFMAHAHALLAAKLVGTGIRPRLTEEVPQQVRRRTMDLWRQWVDEADAERLRDLYGLQNLAARTMVESGEALIRFDPAPSERIPWTVRVLEPDWLDMSQHRLLDDGAAIVMGVEYDARGRRVAYHMHTEHPGADLFTRRPSTRIERVPAEFIAPVFWATRPEQTHGVPWCVPSVTTARHLDDLNDARLKRSKVQACFAAFIRKNPEATAITTDVQTGRRRQQLAPGIVEYLLPDEDVSFAVPPRGEGDDEWQIMLLHAIAAGCGITYSQLTGDLRQVNYSSMRAGMLDFWDLLDVWQNIVLKPMLCRPLWRTFDRIAAAGQGRAQLLNVEWDFPDRPFIDPQKDGDALDAALLAGRKTFRQVVSEYGTDPEAHIDELRRERAELADLGLPHMQTAAQRSVATTDQDNGEDEEMPMQRRRNGSNDEDMMQ